MSSSPEPDPEVDTALTFLTRRSAELGDLLRTNLPPSEQEANLREIELSDVYDALEVLDQEIEQAQLIVLSLKRKRKRIYEIIHKYKTVLSPVRRLAPEILMEIFLWMTKDLPEGGFDVTDVTSGPWVISHVSRLWREVSLNCSELWSCFYIQRDVDDYENWDKALFLNTALIRSGKRGLCVDYDCRFLIDGESWIHLESLMAHSLRWKHVSLVLPEDMLEYTRQIRGSLGSLESLEIHMEPVYRGITIDAFEFAPRLTRIKIVSRPAAIRQEFVFPWSQLISYHEELEQTRVDSMSILLSLLEVIRKCTALENLTIPSFGPLDAADDTSEVPYVTHSAIRHLIAKSHSIIPFLTLPSLETLTLDLGAHTAPEATLDVRHLILRSDCSITELNLRGITPGKEVVELLRCTPKLTRLAFRYRYSQWKNNVNKDFIRFFKEVDRT